MAHKHGVASLIVYKFANQVSHQLEGDLLVVQCMAYLCSGNWIGAWNYFHWIGFISPRYLEDFQWIGTSRLENYYPTGPTDFPAAKDLSIQSSQPSLAACSVASPLTFALAPPWQPDKQKTILARG